MKLQKIYTFNFINANNDKNIFEKALTKSINTGMISRTEQNNKFIMNSKYYQSHEFIIEKEQIILDEKLVSNLTNLILKNLELSKKIPTINGLEKGEYKEIKEILNQ